MKYFPLASLLSLLLVMPACNWRGRCCQPPCATSCTAPCATSCTTTTCNTRCEEVVTEVPLTYSAPIVPTADGQVYTQKPEAYQEQAYLIPAGQEANFKAPVNSQADYYDASDMK